MKTFDTFYQVKYTPAYGTRTIPYIISFIGGVADPIN